VSENRFDVERRKLAICERGNVEASPGVSSRGTLLQASGRLASVNGRVERSFV
jgi:hypothetical protein